MPKETNHEIKAKRNTFLLVSENYGGAFLVFNPDLKLLYQHIHYKQPLCSYSVFVPTGVKLNRFKKERLL